MIFSPGHLKHLLYCFWIQMFTFFYSCLSVITPPKTILSDPSATLVQVKVIPVVSFKSHSVITINNTDWFRGAAAVLNLTKAATPKPRPADSQMYPAPSLLFKAPPHPISFLHSYTRTPSSNVLDPSWAWFFPDGHMVLIQASLWSAAGRCAPWSQFRVVWFMKKVWVRRERDPVVPRERVCVCVWVIIHLNLPGGRKHQLCSKRLLDVWAFTEAEPRGDHTLHQRLSSLGWRLTLINGTLTK